MIYGPREKLSRKIVKSWTDALGVPESNLFFVGKYADELTTVTREREDNKMPLYGKRNLVAEPPKLKKRRGPVLEFNPGARKYVPVLFLSSVSLSAERVGASGSPHV